MRVSNCTSGHNLATLLPLSRWLWLVWNQSLSLDSGKKTACIMACQIHIDSWFITKSQLDKTLWNVLYVLQRPWTNASQQISYYMTHTFLKFLCLEPADDSIGPTWTHSGSQVKGVQLPLVPAKLTQILAAYPVVITPSFQCFGTASRSTRALINNSLMCNEWAS